MTLQEAINTGKRFARSIDADTGDYVTAAEYLESGISLEDFNAADYEVEPDVTEVTLSRELLASVWNNAKGSSTSIATADRSEFFSRFLVQLQNKGIKVS